MATKLTLRMDERLIEVAKRHAAAHETSVSRMVAAYFEALVAVLVDMNAARHHALALLEPFDVVSVDRAVLVRALDAGFADSEDGVLHDAAARSGRAGLAGVLVRGRAGPMRLHWCTLRSRWTSAPGDRMKHTTVSVRELKTRLSHYLRLAKAGESVEITERGVPIGRIVPTSAPIEDRMEAMARTGLVEWNRQRLARVAPPARTSGPHTVSELLIEDRA